MNHQITLIDHQVQQMEKLDKAKNIVLVEEMILKENKLNMGLTGIMTELLMIGRV